MFGMFEDDCLNQPYGDMYSEDWDDRMIEGTPTKRYKRTIGTHGKTCRNCGETGLGWIQDGANWRLAKGHDIHICKVSPLIEHCPFCGSEDVRVKELYQEPQVGWAFPIYAVGCNECGATGPSFKGLKNKAIELWNER